MIHEKTTRKRQENRSMKIENRTPHQDGFYMPGEFEPQDGVILIWPKRPGSWPYEAKEAGKVFADILPVKEQVVGLQRGHQAGILERRQISGRRAPGEKQEAFARVGADQLAQCLPAIFRRYHLKIVNEQDFPPIQEGRKGKIRRARVQPQHIPSGEQGIGQRAFPEAAGRAEKEDAPALHKAVKPLPDRRLHDNIPGHVLPPFRRQRDIPRAIRIPTPFYPYYT